MLSAQLTPEHHIKPGMLRQYSAFSALCPEQIIPLAFELELKLAEAGEELIEFGSTTNNMYFLVDGELELVGRSGEVLRIHAGTPAAYEPIAGLRPCQYSVRAGGQVRYFVVNKLALEQMIRMAPQEPLPAGDQTLSMMAHKHPMYLDFRKELKENRIKLPSLPEVAYRIRDAISRGDDSSERLARIVNTDPSMATKLIRVANSPIYRGRSEITSCKAAITRLGVTAAHELVTCYSLRDLFSSNSENIRARMKAHWEHAQDVAAIAAVLARMTFDYEPETAMLAGLLHDIGVVPILGYAEDYFGADIDDQELDLIISELKAEMGSMMLSKWNINRIIVNVAQHGSDWMYDSTKSADYADLVIVAKLHSYIGKKGMIGLPRIDTVPAFHKLSLGELTPQMSIKILEDAKVDIAEARALLSL
jgi:HD-like signal output (HDOD) protein